MNYATTLSGGTVGYTCQPVAYLFQVFRKVTEMKLSKAAQDITGKKYGRLTAIKPVGRNKASNIIWLCECECGGTKETTPAALNSKHVRSCGCLEIESRTKSRRTHGKTNTPEWNAWTRLRNRCNNPNSDKFDYYGERGISVCERWDDFEVFLKDMGKQPSPRHSIDRIDPDGDYSPENCRWANQTQQANNKRNNKLIEYNGETRTITDWAQKYNINRSTLNHRVKDGWDIERALKTPVRITKRTVNPEYTGERI